MFFIAARSNEMKFKKNLLALAAFSVLGLGVTAQAAVVNGGFEMGSFAGWSQGGVNGFTGVQCPGPDPAVQSGNCSAFFGTIGSTTSISQVLSTSAGTSYDISFWLRNDGGTPSSFAFNWDGGAAEVSLTNMSADAAFVHYTLNLAASSANTDISFSFRDDPGFLFLDNVSVIAAAAEVPEPGSLALLGMGLVGLAAARKRKQA